MALDEQKQPSKIRNHIIAAIIAFAGGFVTWYLMPHGQDDGGGDSSASVSVSGEKR